MSRSDNPDQPRRPVWRDSYFPDGSSVPAVEEIDVCKIAQRARHIVLPAQCLTIDLGEQVGPDVFPQRLVVLFQDANKRFQQFDVPVSQLVDISAVVFHWRPLSVPDAALSVEQGDRRVSFNPAPALHESGAA